MHYIHILCMTKCCTRSLAQGVDSFIPHSTGGLFELDDERRRLELIHSVSISIEE